MRISELSAASGVPVPTLKYYLREGLLPPGEATAVNQARYGEAHLRRLSLIRALTEIGGLPLKSVKTVVAGIDDETFPLHELLGVAHYALEPAAPAGAVPMRDTVDSLLDDLGWRVDEDAPGRRTLGWALATLRDLGRDVSPQGGRARGSPRGCCSPCPAAARRRRARASSSLGSTGSTTP